MQNVIKNSLLTITVVFFFIVAKAQESTVKSPARSKFSVEVSVGPSFPLRDFASKDTSIYTPSPTSNDMAGWASTGIGLNISAGYRLNKSFTLIFMLGGQQNKVDKTTYRKTLRNSREDDSLIVKTKSWKIGKLMAGGSFALPISRQERLFFQLKVLIGSCKTALPELKYIVYDKDGQPGMEYPFLREYGFRSKTPLSWALCYQVGAGLRYFFTPKLSWFANIAYFDASAIHKYSYHPVSNPSTRVVSKWRYRLTSINPEIGIALAF